MTPEGILEICRTRPTAEALDVLREYVPDADQLIIEDPDGSPYLEEVQAVWAQMPERLRPEMVDAIEASVGWLQTAVQRFIDVHVHGALKWEDPLPIPPQILALQEVLDNPQSAPHLVPDGCKWCAGEREPHRRI